MRSWPSLTAEAVCLARALEHRRTERGAEALVDDPFARGFLRAPMRAVSHAASLSGGVGDLAEWGLDPGLVASIAARHGHFDRVLARHAPDLEQVLILGAGYDSRAWRLPLDHTVFVELDHPATARRKARRLARRRLDPGRRHAITADLAVESLPDVLAASPLQADRATAVVWEGVTMYLDEVDVVRTLDALHAWLGPGSLLLADLWSRTRYPLALAAAEAAGRTSLAALGEPLRFAIDPLRLGTWFEGHGWRVLDHTDTDSVAQLVAGRRAYPRLELVVAEPIGGRAGPP